MVDFGNFRPEGPFQELESARVWDRLATCRRSKPGFIHD
jgi:hypothetical protein